MTVDAVADAERALERDQWCAGTTVSHQTMRALIRAAKAATDGAVASGVGLLSALAPLVAIADSFDANELDDGARKSWGRNDEFTILSQCTPDEIQLYAGRGGKELLTLADCFAARDEVKRAALASPTPPPVVEAGVVSQEVVASGAEAEDWLIRKGGYFYRPNRAGYTTRKSEAGRYSEADAKAEARVESGMQAIRAEDWPDDAKPAPEPAVDAVREALIEAYDKVKEWPELRMSEGSIEALGEGFMDFLALRNLVPSAIAALAASPATSAARGGVFSKAIRALNLAIEDRQASDTVEMNVGDLSVMLGLLLSASSAPQGDAT